MWAEAMRLAETSVRLDPRSSFAFSILSWAHAMEGHYEAAMDAAKRAVALNPYDMGARGVLGICHFVIGEHREAIELFSMAAQRDNSDPRYQWAALNAFSHYLLGQYDATLSWAREQLYINPNHMQALAIRAAALAQLGRNDEAFEAAGVLMGNYPTLNVDRHLRNFHWKRPEDLAPLPRGSAEGRRAARQIDPGPERPQTRRRVLTAGRRSLQQSFGNLAPPFIDTTVNSATLRYTLK